MSWARARAGADECSLGRCTSIRASFEFSIAVTVGFVRVDLNPLACPEPRELAGCVPLVVLFKQKINNFYTGTANKVLRHCTLRCFITDTASILPVSLVVYSPSDTPISSSFSYRSSVGPGFHPAAVQGRNKTGSCWLPSSGLHRRGS